MLVNDPPTTHVKSTNYTEGVEENLSVDSLRQGLSICSVSAVGFEGYGKNVANKLAPVAG